MKPLLTATVKTAPATPEGPASTTTRSCISPDNVFDLPEVAEALARSEQTALQAFRRGNAANGLLFHLEVTPKIVSGMTEAFHSELRGDGLDGAAIRE